MTGQLRGVARPLQRGLLLLAVLVGLLGMHGLASDHGSAAGAHSSAAVVVEHAGPAARATGSIIAASVIAQPMLTDAPADHPALKAPTASCLAVLGASLLTWLLVASRSTRRTFAAAPVAAGRADVRQPRARPPSTAAPPLAQLCVLRT